VLNESFLEEKDKKVAQKLEQKQKKKLRKAEEKRTGEEEGSRRNQRSE